MSSLSEALSQFWREIAERPTGPLAFRFYVQPVMSGLLALRDGIKDAQTGRTPYFWKLLHDPERRSASLKEGVSATTMVLALALVLDIAYQYFVLGEMHPLQAIVVAFLLGFLPYLLLRGPFDRLARRWLHRRRSGQ